MNWVNTSKILAALIFQFSLTLCIAQNTVGGRNAGGSDITEGPGGTIQQINNMSEAKIIGSKYLNSEWQKGDMEYLNGHNIQGVLLRYDVETGNVEQYEMDSTHNSIHDSKIKKVVIYADNSSISETLLNGGDFKLNEVPIIGLVRSEELAGKFNLITSFRIKKSAGTYNKVLDTGNEESKIEVTATTYLTEGHKLTVLPKNKKKLANIFDESNSELILSYVKSNNISVKRYDDLVKLISYANSLNKN